MSAQTIRLLVAGALLVHGIGHTMGFWMPVRSWLLGSLSEPTRRRISAFFWIFSTLGFVLASLGFIGALVPHDWWQPIAVVTSFISLAGLLIFFGNWPVFNTIGAFVMNLLILGKLLFDLIPLEI